MWALRHSKARNLPVLVLVAASALGGACGGSSGGATRTPAGTPARGQTVGAEAPRVAIRVSSLRLTRRVPAPVRSACAATVKEKPTVPVVCPAFVPAGRISRDPNLSGPIIDFQDRAFWVMTFNNGGTEGLTHWIVGAGRTASVRDQVLTDRHNETMGLPELVRRQRLEGHQVAVFRYRAGGGYNSGHIGAFVTCGNLTVFSTIHGFRHADAATAMALDLARSPAFRCPASR